MGYWNREMETIDRGELKKLQSERLCAMVRHVYDNVEHYRNKMKERGITPDDIKSVDDLKLLPFCEKSDLRDTYPFGLFAVPMSEVIRLQASSGTTGKQIVVGYTQNDLDVWSEVTARAICAVGGTKDDLIHISYGYGLFTGGLGMHYGAERMKATVVPVSTGNSARQVNIIKDFGSSIICCTPSYALSLADTMDEMGISPSELKLRAGIMGAEPWSEQMRREIERRLGIKAYDIYGLTEITGPGVACECSEQSGMHINEDHFIPEIIDPETGEVLPIGQQGELVFTCITKEAFPLLRYRTRDITSLVMDECPCKRTFLKMKKPCGRTDDMLIIRGVNVFPSQVESVLLELGLTSAHYMLIVDRVNNLDTLEIMVEMTGEMFTDHVKGLEETARRISAAMASTLGLTAKVTLVDPKTIKRSEGKAVRVIDKRKI